MNVYDFIWVAAFGFGALHLVAMLLVMLLHVIWEYIDEQEHGRWWGHCLWLCPVNEGSWLHRFIDKRYREYGIVYHFTDIDENRKGYVIYTWSFFFFAPMIGGSTGSFIVACPVISAFMVSGLLTIVFLKHARRAQKKLSKLWRRLDTHIADKNAHK